LKEFLAQNHLLHPEYVQCLDSTEIWDPYKLAQNAEKVIIYNGTLGIEIPALGIPVINIANSHYSRKGFTYDIDSKEQLEVLLRSGNLKLTKEQQNLALSYLYYYVYMANLPIDNLLVEFEPFEFHLPPDFDKAGAKKQFDDVQIRIEFLLRKTIDKHLSYENTVPKYIR
jgi:hypothetical protein